MQTEFIHTIMSHTNNSIDEKPKWNKESHTAVIICTKQTLLSLGNKAMDVVI
jgi:hypothetical protein